MEHIIIIIHFLGYIHTNFLKYNRLYVVLSSHERIAITIRLQYDRVNVGAYRWSSGPKNRPIQFVSIFSIFY